MESIRISCIGDLLPADTTYTIGNGIGNKISGLIDHYSLQDNNPFYNSDIVFCNLEAPLIINPDTVKLPFAGNPAIVQLLKILGITVVSIANNHMLDHGPEGFHQTTHTLAENGIFQTGISENGISNIIYLEIKGKKFAFAAFSAIQDHPENMFLAPLERNILFNTLEAIKKQSADYTLFSFHWGNEYISYPSPSQVDLAHELIDQGVNIIIGHHPHVVQPIEKYHGGIIMYSLGNFLFDMFWSEAVRNGMQVDLVFHDDKSIDYQIKPFRIKSNFILDYTNSSAVLTGLSKAGKTLELLQAGPSEAYQKIYLSECRKRRFRSRLQMKIYLLKNLFNLSPQSRELFFRNIKMKSGFLWRKK